MSLLNWFSKYKSVLTLEQCQDLLKVAKHSHDLKRSDEGYTIKTIEEWISKTWSPTIVMACPNGDYSKLWFSSMLPHVSPSCPKCNSILIKKEVIV